MLRVIELFSGVGSQTQALKNIGVEHKVVAICDNDKFADMTYRALHDADVVNLGDIRKVEELPEADLWTYSFPCQDISVAGNQKGFDKDSNTRSGLLWEVERLLLRAKEKGTLPKYLLLENVKNLVGIRHKANYEKWLAFLHDLGYTTFWKVLNAKDYGIPQNRERVFAISILGECERYEFPKPMKLETRLKDVLEDEVDKKYYLKESTMRSMLTSSFKNRKNSVYTPDASHTGALLSRDYKEPKCVVVGNIEQGKWGKVTEMHQRVYSPEGIAPTITAQGGGNQEKKIVVDDEPKAQVVGMMEGGKWDRVYNLSRCVYDPEGIAPTLVAAAGEGGNNTKKIIVDDLYANREKRTYEEVAPTLRGERHGLKVVALRGRPPEDGHKNLEQQAEIRKDYLTNTITTVQKDNLILQVKSGRKKGYEEATDGDSINLAFPNSKTRRGRVGKQISNTIDTGCQQGVLLNCTIRKLTPTECWRLMGWKDEQINKVKQAGISNSQMYKQAGNGIVVAVLEAIFLNLPI